MIKGTPSPLAFLENPSSFQEAMSGGRERGGVGMGICRSLVYSGSESIEHAIKYQRSKAGERESTRERGSNNYMTTSLPLRLSPDKSWGLTGSRRWIGGGGGSVTGWSRFGSWQVGRSRRDGWDILVSGLGAPRPSRPDPPFPPERSLAPCKLHPNNMAHGITNQIFRNKRCGATRNRISDHLRSG